MRHIFVQICNKKEGVAFLDELVRLKIIKPSEGTEYINHHCWIDGNQVTFHVQSCIYTCMTENGSTKHILSYKVTPLFNLLLKNTTKIQDARAKLNELVRQANNELRKYACIALDGASDQ